MDARRRRTHPDDEAETQANRREVQLGDRGALRELNPGPTDKDSLELTLAGLECFNAGDMDGFWAVHDQQCLMVTDPDWPGGGRHEGLDEFQRFIEGFTEAFETVRFELDSEPERIGELSLFRGRWVGRGAASGIDTESQQFTFVSEARDGKIVELHFFFRDSQAREHARSQI